MKKNHTSNEMKRLEDVQGAGAAAEEEGIPSSEGERIPSSAENLFRIEGVHTPRVTLAIKEFKRRKYLRFGR